MSRYEKIPEEEWVMAFDRLCRHFGVSRSQLPSQVAEEIISSSDRAARYIREDRAHTYDRLLAAERELRDLKKGTKA